MKMHLHAHNICGNLDLKWSYGITTPADTHDNFPLQLFFFLVGDDDSTRGIIFFRRCLNCGCGMRRHWFGRTYSYRTTSNILVHCNGSIPPGHTSGNKLGVDVIHMIFFSNHLFFFCFSVFFRHEYYVCVARLVVRIGFVMHLMRYTLNTGEGGRTTPLLVV